MRSDTGTLVSLKPLTGPDFDFAPARREAERQANGYVHLGDLNLRLRTTDGVWHDFASAHARKPLRALPASHSVLSAADMTGALGEDIPPSAQSSVRVMLPVDGL